jgi:hypothetical protein
MPGAVLPLRFRIAAIGLRRLFASVNSAAPSFVVTTDGGTFAVLVGDASHYGGRQQCFTDLASYGNLRPRVGLAPERSRGRRRR